MNPLNLAAVGWQDLVVCGKTAGEHVNPDYVHSCDFKDLVLASNHVITDLVFLSTFLATISFIIVGIKLLTSGGNPGAMNDAKDTLFKVVIGYVIVLAAWLVVYTITSVLLNSDFILFVK